jgi:hypothetical protein
MRVTSTIKTMCYRSRSKNSEYSIAIAKEHYLTICRASWHHRAIYFSLLSLLKSNFSYQNDEKLIVHGQNDTETAQEWNSSR